MVLETIQTLIHEANLHKISQTTNISLKVKTIKKKHKKNICFEINWRKNYVNTNHLCIFVIVFVHLCVKELKPKYFSVTQVGALEWLWLKVAVNCVS